MTYEVDGWNNFLRVFELPEKPPHGYCFNGGVLTTFNMVDQFRPFSDLPTPAVSKEVWKEKVGEIQTKKVTLEELETELKEFLLNKMYVKPNRKYIVITGFEACFMFSKESE